MFFIISWICIGAVGFHFFEKWTWISSFYFSVTTLATVGYGDLHPTTDVSKLFTIFYIIFGAGIFVSAISILSDVFMRFKEESFLENYKQIKTITKKVGKLIK